MTLAHADDAHLIATVIELTCAVLLAGISWYRALVHIPLLRAIPGDHLPLHTRSIALMDSIMIYPLMVIETLSTGVAAAIVFRGDLWGFEQVSLASLLAVWLPVLFIARPAFSRLSSGFAPKPFRTFLAVQRWLAAWWSVRGVFLLVLFLHWAIPS